MHPNVRLHQACHVEHGLQHVLQRLILSFCQVQVRTIGRVWHQRDLLLLTSMVYRLANQRFATDLQHFALAELALGSSDVTSQGCIYREVVFDFSA